MAGRAWRNRHAASRIQIEAGWRAAGRRSALRRGNYFPRGMHVARARHALRLAHGISEWRVAFFPWRNYKNGFDRRAVGWLFALASRIVNSRIPFSHFDADANRPSKIKSRRVPAHGEYELLRRLRIVGPGANGSGLGPRRRCVLRARRFGTARWMGRGARPLVANLRQC